MGESVCDIVPVVRAHPVQEYVLCVGQVSRAAGARAPSSPMAETFIWAVSRLLAFGRRIVL